MNYKIQKEELEYLFDRVEKLLKIAKDVCEQKIQSFVMTKERSVLVSETK
jgi:hypothetical protein